MCVDAVWSSGGEERGGDELPSDVLNALHCTATNHSSYSRKLTTDPHSGDIDPVYGPVRLYTATTDPHFGDIDPVYGPVRLYTVVRVLYSTLTGLYSLHETVLSSLFSP